MDRRLEGLRNKINIIDDRLTELMAERLSIVRQIGELKKELNLPVEDPERERAVLDRLHNRSAGPALINIYQAIFKASRDLQQK